GLLDELRTYEHELKKKKEEQVTPFPTALMTTPRVPSSEGTCPRSCDTPSSSQPSSSKMENYDEEFALMVKQFRKFKKFFKKADSVRRPTKGKPQVSDSPPESYLCYNCRKPGHWKSACPYPKVEKYGERERNEKKKKAMIAAESDESSSSSSDEDALVCMERRVEKSNQEDRWTMSEDDTLCLMAKDDADQEVTSQTSCSSSYESIQTSENLFDQFKKMMVDFEEINLKHSSLTEENKLLSEENLKLTEGRKSQLNEITQLKTENESLSEKVKSLNKELWTLKSKEAVDKLLETTKHKGREGLGFDPSSSKRKGRTTFIPPKPTAKTNKQKGKEKEKPTEVPKKVVGANVHFQKLEAKCSSSTFFQSYMEMIGAQELSEFLQMEIRLKFEEEVLEFYRNGEVKTAHSKKDPQRTFPVIKSTVGGTKVKLSQKKLGEKLRLPNSGVEVGKFPVKNLDWNIIGISGQIPSGLAKKADLNNDYKLILELVIACLECGSGGHADDITQKRAFIINALITKTKVNWAAHFFNSISKHLGKPNQKYLCQGLYLGHILESMGIASKEKKYGERYWLYYLSSKGENRAGTTVTAEESSSDNVLLIHMAKTAKRKQVVSPSISIEAPQNLALACLEEEEEVSDHGELQRKKKKKINSPSTSGNVNPDELKEKETAEETSVQNRSPQQFEEETPQVPSLPTPSSQPHTDDADNKFWQLYNNWRAWKVGNSKEQLLDWDQQLKNEKIIKKCLGIPVNHNCEDILKDYWVWQKNPEDLHMEYLANTPVSDCEADDEDTAVFKPVFTRATEEQMALTSEEIAASPPQEQNQEATEEEEFQRLIQSQVLEILTTPCEISNQTQLEILEKSAEIPEQSAIPETMEKAVEVQRHSGEAEKETQMAEVEVSQTPIAIFEEPNEAEDSDSLSRYISNFALDEAEGESERTLKVTDEEDVQEDAESLPLQLFQRTSSPHQ
ncbi:unnamed protein product, partial [Cuscuta campestris]